DSQSGPPRREIHGIPCRLCPGADLRPLPGQHDDDRNAVRIRHRDQFHILIRPARSEEGLELPVEGERLLLFLRRKDPPWLPAPETASAERALSRRAQAFLR